MFVCSACTYPSRLPAACDNPGCEVNLSQAQRDVYRAEREKRAAEEAERERIRSIRRRMMESR